MANVEQNIVLDYETRIVLFLDFLGFKNKIKNSTVEEVIELYKIISDIFGINDEYFEAFGSKSVSQFSDCLAISYNIKKDKESILMLIENIQRSHVALIMKDVLVRGAMCIDKLYHKYFPLRNGNNSKLKIVFGEGIINAYKLESSVSQYPRTIVTDEVVKFFKKNTFKEYKGMFSAPVLKKSLIKDCDGYSYIDYIHNPFTTTILNQKGINETDY